MNGDYRIKGLQELRVIARLRASKWQWSTEARTIGTLYWSDVEIPSCVSPSARLVTMLQAPSVFDSRRC